ncbi:MAG: ATP phosphoribosyltransferase regulatory subunit [Aquisalimonadaceae bacterium]
MKETDFSNDNRWLLPEGVDEVLPPRAEALEQLRRRILDTCRSWGYDLIVPPFIEFLESLLTGTAHDLDLQTFRLTDQISGRMMGVRADMTPQAARIDAHQLHRESVVRLCYLGTVLHTRPEGPGHSRNPVQVGAELYGHAGVESDVEIIGLMLETLRLAGLPTPHLDLGHVGIYRALAHEAGLDANTENRLFDALQRKATGEIQELLSGVAGGDARQRLLALVDLNGGVEVLDHAGERLAGAGEGVQQALRHLWALASTLERREPGVTLHFDLAELSGYRFHNGVVFAAFLPGHGKAVARGGRYDNIGGAFGRARPATGFSADLKVLLSMAGEGSNELVPQGILAPWSDDPDLLAEIRRLRGLGERVIAALPGRRDSLEALGCNRRLVERDDRWQVTELK